MTEPRDADRFRNILAFALIGAFIAVIALLVFKTLAPENKDIITYMVGQLSGMATTALGFYFVNKVGQEALDAKRAENTGKLADAITASRSPSVASEPDVILQPGETARADDTR